MIADVMREANNRMKGAIASLESDLGAFRTGRASTKLVEHLRVEQYGVEMQLNQMATISVPERSSWPFALTTAAPSRPSRRRL